MQDFRLYNDPTGMLLLHSGSIEKAECVSEVDPIEAIKASQAGSFSGLCRAGKERPTLNLRMVTPMVVPVIDLKATGRNIKALRQTAGLSVRDLQTVLGFTNPQAIYKWQNGDSLPSIDNLVILAAVLGVTVDEILVVDGEEDGDWVSDKEGLNITKISVQW